MGVCASSSVTGDVVPSQPPSTTNIKPGGSTEEKAPNPELLENPRSSVWDGQEIWDGEQDWQQDESGHWATEEPSQTDTSEQQLQQNDTHTTNTTSQQQHNPELSQTDTSEQQLQQNDTHTTDTLSQQQHDPETTQTDSSSRQDNPDGDHDPTSDPTPPEQTNTVPIEEDLRTKSSSEDREESENKPATDGDHNEHPELVTRESKHQLLQEDQKQVNHEISQREQTNDTGDHGSVESQNSGEENTHHDSRPLSTKSKLSKKENSKESESETSTQSESLNVTEIEKNQVSEQNLGETTSQSQEEHDPSQHPPRVASSAEGGTKQAHNPQDAQQLRPDSRDITRTHEESAVDNVESEFY